jgi:hypothetical protein
MSDTCIIYYHSSAWDGIPGRQRHLMEAISRYIPIVYIEEAHDRKWRVTYRQIGDNVTLVRGLASVLVKFERRKWKLASRLWCRWHLGWVRRKYRRVIFWDAENWLRPFRFIPHDLLVFDCIDPCFGNDPADVDLYLQRERELLAAADLVFATADALAEQCRRRHDDVTLINNACAPQEYTAAKIAASPRPSWWPATDKPVAAYLGSLDWRFDFQAMLAACWLNQNVHFVLAGYLLAELQSAAAELRAMPNVTLTGRISVEEGRYLLAHCSMGLIPFTMGAINDAINPVKLYAYALLGKPVVGTRIRELESRPQVARTGGTPEEFAEQVARAVAESGNDHVRETLIAFAMENTWDHRARLALSRLMPDLCLPPSHRVQSTGYACTAQ